MGIGIQSTRVAVEAGSALPAFDRHRRVDQFRLSHEQRCNPNQQQHRGNHDCDPLPVIHGEPMVAGAPTFPLGCERSAELALRLACPVPARTGRSVQAAELPDDRPQVFRVLLNRAQHFVWARTRGRARFFAFGWLRVVFHRPSVRASARANVDLDQGSIVIVTRSCKPGEVSQRSQAPEG